MRRKIFAVVTVALLCLTGCSQRDSAKEVDVETAAQSILEQVEFRDSLVKADQGAAENFYQLDDTVESYAIYISGSGATAEEIAVLKAAKGSGAEGVKEVLNHRIEELKFRFQDYIPEEMVKLEEPVIVTQGDVAVLVLADDYDAAKKAADSVF